MATTNTLIMGYVLKQVNNIKSPVNHRWFAHVDRRGTLTTRGLAQHMIEHGLVGNRAEVEAILTKLSECVPELVGQGYYQTETGAKAPKIPIAAAEEPEP